MRAVITWTWTWARAWALSLLLLASCSRNSDEPPTPAPAAPEQVKSDQARSEPATFALGYEPARSEARIVAAQQQVRRAPDQAGGYVALAEAFLIRWRETAEASYMGYAKDALAAARELAPRDPAVMTTRIMMLMDGHAFAEAASTAREVIAMGATGADPTTAYLLLSDALLELGDTEGAVAALQQAMDRFPDLRAHSRAAHLRWLHGDVDGALESMDDALRAGSRDPEAVAWCYVDLGMMLWHQGQLDPALRAAQKALELVAGYPPALSLQARVLEARSEQPGPPEARERALDQAVAALEQVVERQPTTDELLRLAEILARRGRRDDAARTLARAEILARHDPLPLALYHARHGTERERALALADKAVAERATVHTHDVMALALLRAGRVKDANAAMDRALALNTPDARLVLHRGLIELAAGHRDAARASLDRANQQNPHADPLLARELAAMLEAP
jgi:tetratricopeptide (TPR) repeat protein